MKQNGVHNVFRKLYQTNIFTSTYERVAGEFTAELFWDDLTKNFLNHIPAGGTILEIGAGPGILATKILRHHPDLTLIVSDFSPQMLSLAQKNYQERICSDEQFKKVQPKVRFVQADVMDLSQFTGEAIDGIYSMGAIKHFPEALHGLQQCTAILKTGGQMFFADFVAEASFSDLRGIAKYLTIPTLLKFVIILLVYLGNKQESPTHETIQRWKQSLEKRGHSALDYALGTSMFILTFTKR